MKIKCKKLIDEQTGETLDSSSWLSIGKEYCVLSVHVQHGLPIKFQLVSNDGATPAYHDANQFEIVTSIIPTSWIIDFESESYFKLSPKAWCEPGFWEDYFDGVPEAIALYNTEKDKLLQE